MFFVLQKVHRPFKYSVISVHCPFLLIYCIESLNKYKHKKMNEFVICPLACGRKDRAFKVDQTLWEGGLWGGESVWFIENEIWVTELTLSMKFLVSRSSSSRSFRTDFSSLVSMSFRRSCSSCWARFSFKENRGNFF